MVVNFDINVFTIIDDRSMLSYTDAGRRPYNMWPHKRKILKIAQAIIKFAGDVQIAEIVRCQFYLWP